MQSGEPATMRRPETLADRRISRRSAVLAGSLGAATVVGGSAFGRAAAQVATPIAEIAEATTAHDGLAVEVIEMFDALPGTKALAFWAPPDAGRPAWFPARS